MAAPCFDKFIKVTENFIYLKFICPVKKYYLSPKRVYIAYYTRVSEYYPEVFGGEEILGFCYYQTGQYEKAWKSYQKSISIHPDFFWAHYNLGLFYFQKGRYKEAADFFQKAVQCDPGETLKKMYASRVYREILRNAGEFNYKVDQGLKEAYQHTAKLLVLSQRFIQTPVKFDPVDFLGKQGVRTDILKFIV
ncbi:hypothetical protein MNBD_UNCLBAC01-857 [hydrothermal vent metagenome]|uniref:Uncharacterized protein n=1 Tax=hydrothermal vent metagenome TaxID=652676 RepID=A0A3B1D4W2_9ZZZZ